MSEIGRRMKRNKSTISRELSRNTDESHRVYFPDTAQEKMKTRRKQAKVIFASVSAKTIAEVKQRLEQHHQEKRMYQKYLTQTQKRRRKGRNQKRGGIPNRIGIENRPKIADLKTEIGHWASDTVIGCNLRVLWLRMLTRHRST
jgi:IS30 family transposase